VVRYFGDMHHVVTFADVNLQDLYASESDSSVRRSKTSFVQTQLLAEPEHEWPLLRYFNSVTGMEGGGYIRKLPRSDGRLCQELSNKYFYLLDFFEEASEVSFCATDGSNCDESALRYLKEHRGAGTDLYNEELDRLQQEYDSESRDHWLWQRQQIIKLLLSEEASAAEL
jgi:hypothetical protein